METTPTTTPLTQHIKAAQRSSAEQQDLDTSLLFAVGGGERARARALIRRGANPSAPKNRPGLSAPQNKTTALIAAAELGNDKILKALLSAPTLDAQATDSFGDSALAWAASFGHVECLKMLVPLSNVHGKNEVGQTALMLAARRGSADCIKELIGISDARDVDHGGTTALMIASGLGQLEAAAVLVEGSDIDAEDQYGNTALCHAIIYQEEDVCRFLAPLSSLRKTLALGENTLDLAHKLAQENPSNSAARRIYDIVFSIAEQKELAAATKLEMGAKRSAPTRAL